MENTPFVGEERTSPEGQLLEGGKEFRQGTE